jgi:threonine dehydrogenase-like Zn-dependent dehydrogenase
VQRFMPELLEFIWQGKLNPEVIISHRMSLEQAAEGYRMFDKKEDNCRKVILRP